MRRARRVALVLAGGCLVLNARPLSYLLLLPRLGRLRLEMPAMFDGAAAVAAIDACIEQDRALWA